MMPIGSSTDMHNSLMERCLEAAGSGSSPENGADNSCEVHATRGHPTSATCDAAAAPQVGKKRQRPSADPPGDERTSTGDHDHHVVDHPPAGAKQPRPGLYRQLPYLALQINWLWNSLAGHPVCTGAAEQPANESEALKRLARRIRASPEGKFEPSPAPRLLHEITDALLITASDAVAAVGEEEPKLSGNGILKLLAWTVADARGATAPLDKPLALTVGKRLQRQADAVRVHIAGIVRHARDEVAKIHDEAQMHVGSAHLLSTLIESALEQEKIKLSTARDEVYIGFHELESLLEEEAAAPELVTPEPVAPEPAPTPTSAPARTPIMHFPWLVDETLWEDCPMPPDLKAALAPETVELLWEQSRTWAVRPDNAAAWWAIGLPSFTDWSARQQARYEVVLLDQENERLAAMKQIDASDAKIKAMEEGLITENEELADEIVELRRQLALAKAREDGLKQAIVGMSGAG